VKDYVRSSKIVGKEMFIPLTHAPGEAQADFGEALVVIAGVEQKAHFMAFDLPHSDDCFVCAFPAETTEAFLEAHVRAFEYFGSVPTRILYDNTTLAVARILGDGEREKTRAFSELQSHYLFAEKFGGQPRATIRARLRTWSVMCGATSWCRFHARQAGRRSTSSSCVTPWPAARSGCVGIRRPSRALRA